MNVTLLVRSEETRNTICDPDMPDKVTLEIGTYKAEGGDLYVIDLSTSRETVADAKLLANVRDELVGSDVRILKDEPSSKFENNLYSRFCKMEKGLRIACTIAICAEYRNEDIGAKAVFHCN